MMDSSPSSSAPSIALDSLPTELFMDIIDSASGSASDIEEAMFGGDDARLPVELLPFRMSSVCRRWRERTLNTPRAWQRIYLSFDRGRLSHAESAAQQIRYLNLMLSRAGAAPLNVFVGGAPGTVQDYHRSLLDVLRDILPRVQRLSMWTVMESITHRSIFEELVRPTPLLQYLSVNSDDFIASDPGFTRIPFFYDSPKLSEIRLCGVRMSFIDCARYPNLRSLKLSACNFNPAILAHVGHWWPRIEHISLESSSVDSAWPTTMPPMAPLPHLRSLDLHSNGMPPMRYRQLPNTDVATVSFMRIPQPVRSFQGCVIEFFQHSALNLEEFTLRGAYLSQRFVHEILKPCKHLRALHLHDSTCGEDFWSSWAATPSAAPILRELSFHECRFPDEAGSAFVVFLRERRPGATTSSKDASYVGIDALRIAQVPRSMQAHSLTPHDIGLVRAVVPSAIVKEIDDF